MKLLPEEYFLQWEDIDYCTYVRNLGYDIIIMTQSKIWHKVGLTVQEGDRIYNMISRGMRNRLYFFLKFSKGSFKKIIRLASISMLTLPAYILHSIIIKRDLLRTKAILTGLGGSLLILSASAFPNASTSSFLPANSSGLAGYSVAYGFSIRILGICQKFHIYDIFDIFSDVRVSQEKTLRRNVWSALRFQDTRLLLSAR